MSSPPSNSAALVDRDNPWPGLAAFTEEAREFFFGREQETDELSRLVRRQTLTVLFGQSGLGKSSLLQAGLFPLLRETDHLPLYLRLDHSPPISNQQSSIGNLQSAIGNSLVDQVKAALNAAFAAERAEAPAFSADETLWEYFHRKDVDIWSAKNRLLTPVLVFDQFEEIFTLGRADDACRERSRAFLAELACLVENRPSVAVKEKLDSGALDPARFNFEKPSCRVILSLREDFLPDLEGLKQDMPALIHNRLRLKKLNGLQALDIVAKPAPHLLAEGVAERIVEFVAGARGGSAERLAELDVEPPLLSVICRELNERRRALDQTQITADLVSGNRREILTDFYERSVADLPPPMRVFVEDHLLTKSGFRDNLALESALETPGVTRPLIDTLVSRRLLRIEERLGAQRVELTHDVLADVIRASRDARQQRGALERAHRHTRNLRLLVAGLAVVVVGLGIAGFFMLRAQQLESERSARTDVGIASRFLDEGKTADGIAYLLRAARKDPKNPVIAPRLASLLTLRNFLLPEGAPLELGSRVLFSRFSPDGQRVSILCEDGTFAAVNLASGEVLRNKLPSPLSSSSGLAVSGKGTAGLCQDGVVRVLDQDTMQLVREIRFEKKGQEAWAAGDESSVMRVRLENQSFVLADIATGHTRTLPWDTLTLWPRSTRDGRWCVVSPEPRRELHLWDASTGEKRKTLSFGGPLTNCAFSPDGSRLVTLAADDRHPSKVALRIWSVPELEPLADLQLVDNMAPGQPNYTRFSRDSHWLLVASPQGKQVYALDTGTKVGAYVASPFSDVLFSPDGRRFTSLVTGGIQLFDTATGTPATPAMLHDATIRSATFGDNGDVLLTTCSDGFARLWNTATGQLLAEPTLQQSIDLNAALSPDSTRLVIGTFGGTVYRLRVGRGVARPVTLPRAVGSAMPAPFMADSPARLLWLQRDRATVIDAASGREVEGGFAYPEPIGTLDGGQRGIGVRSDLRFMVVITASGKWQAWELGDAGITRIVSLEDAPGGSGWIRFSPTGGLVALIANDDLRKVRFWNLRSGKPVGPPCVYDARIVTQNVIPGGFSPDGRRFVAGTSNGVVRVWDVAAGVAIMQLSPLRDAMVRFVDYSPDGTRIVTANYWGETQLWDAATGRPASAILYHSDVIQGAAFSRDGRYLLTASSDRTARVWDGHDGAPVAEPMSHRADMRSAQFSADGSRVVTASSDATARVWDVQTGQPLTEPMPHPIRLFSAIFSPNGRFLRTETVAAPNMPTAFWLWSVPPPLPAGARTPQWLLDLATICASKTVDDEGRFVDDDAAIAKFDDVRRTLAALPDDAPYVEWGRWILNDRADRSIAPGFTITPAEADKLAAEMAAPPPKEPDPTSP